MDRCLRTPGVSPCSLWPARSVRGSAVTRSDPALTSPCVAKETEELRKREEVGQQGVTTSEKEERGERSLSFHVKVSLLCVPAICLSDTINHRSVPLSTDANAC